jgi:hypothetical protein
MELVEIARQLREDVSGLSASAVCPHPSPANPAANRGWEREFSAALKALGVEPG